MRSRNLFVKSGIQSCFATFYDVQPKVPAHQQAVSTVLKDFMYNAIRSQAGKCSTNAFGKLIMSLALGLLLSACGGSNHNNDRSVVPTPAPTPAPAPVPTPAPTVANTVVAYPSETAELRLYAGQSRQITLNFRTSDNASATELALALPDGGLPAGWSIGSNRKRCELVNVDNLCQIALTYAPAAA